MQNVKTVDMTGISRRSRATISGGGAMGERISRMQGTGVGGMIAEEDPNTMMQRETMSQAHHAEYHIQKEREYEKLHQRLLEEFSQLDLNQDGSVTIDEIIQFLHDKLEAVSGISLYEHHLYRTFSSNRRRERYSNSLSQLR